MHGDGTNMLRVNPNLALHTDDDVEAEIGKRFSSEISRNDKFHNRCPGNEFIRETDHYTQERGEQKFLIMRLRRKALSNRFVISCARY